jgi:cytochrome P450
VNTSTDLLAHTSDEIFRWIASHPEQRDRLASAAFISSAINETLRLHPANAGFIRTVVEDVTLGNGLRLAPGERVILHIGEANRDRDVFGPNADVFDPDRRIPTGILPFGAAFGAGPHMCWGMPLVIGHQDAEGTHLHVLMRLFAEGMEPDPERPPAAVPHMLLHRFASYPVLFPR